MPHTNSDSPDNSPVFTEELVFAEEQAPARAAVLHLFCGRIAAGKSTLARRLARRHHAILISEDEWLAKLYPEEIKGFKDYLECSQRLQALLAPHCVELLKQGSHVVFDFPANTPRSRERLRGIIKEAEARHLLHYLTTSPEQCRVQLAKRIQQQADSSEIQRQASPIALNEFDAINRLFVPPAVEEGFNVEINR